MPQGTLAADASASVLPPTAPKVRMTAGAGSAHQKTWNLRRPVTLLGAARQAHIVLVDATVSKVHGLVVNTGTDVLFRDLHSTNGTQCNGSPVSLSVLNDGDVLQLGHTPIQIAIQSPMLHDLASAVEMTYHEPLKLPQPLTIRRQDSAAFWNTEHLITTIGRRPDTDVHLDHPDVSLVHAAVAWIEGRLMIVDLSSRTGTWLNGQRVSLAPWEPQDRLRIGPMELRWAPAGSTGLTEVQPATVSETAPAGGAGALRRFREELDQRARELDRRAEAQGREEEALTVLQARVENDRRALEQQALALWRARAQIELERKLGCVREPTPSSSTATPLFSTNPGVSAHESRKAAPQPWTGGRETGWDAAGQA